MSLNGRSNILQQEDPKFVGFERQFSALADQNKQLLLECGCCLCNAEEPAYVYMHQPIGLEIEVRILASLKNKKSKHIKSLI